jgi:hypothetical protein
MVMSASKRTNWIAPHALGVTLIVALAATVGFAQQPRPGGPPAKPTAYVGPLDDPTHLDATDQDEGVAFAEEPKIDALQDGSSQDDTFGLGSGERSVPPQGDYVYQSGVSFTYTYSQAFVLTANLAVTFETKKTPPTGSDPVMYLFNLANPTTGGSWSDDDSGDGPQSKITCIPPYTSIYVLLIRSKSGSPQTTSVYKNNTLVASNVTIAAATISCSSLPTTGQLNYFTCKTSGGILPNPCLWLVDNSSTTGVVRAYNDNYTGGGGNWAWGNNARVKQSFSTGISYVILGASNSLSWGTCDVYMKCKNGTYGPPDFPNLKLDDEIRSAPYSGSYNCIAWSGGISTFYVWPPQQGSPWYNPNALLPGAVNIEQVYPAA